jgi:hypothetical protein
MAKMFYTMDEAKAALGRTEDEIKQLSKDGKLREFRDGVKLMFKADQVEALKGSLPAKDVVDIQDSGAPISLVDSKSGSSSGIPLSGGSNSGVSIKDDTGMGEPALGGSKGGSRAGSRSGSGTGMNIFNIDDADPSAATAITPASESGNLESVGSGSGLLDLTRESDDTSLGAVLDDIAPGKRDAQASRAGSASGIAAAPVSSGVPSGARVSGPTFIVKPDASADFFGGLALGGAVLCIFGLFVLASGVTGSPLAIATTLAERGFIVVAGVFAGVLVVCGGIGFGLGKVLK